MGKVWFLKVLCICGCICVGLFLFTAHSNGQFGYALPGIPDNIVTGFSPYLYGFPDNIMPTYSPYLVGYQQPYWEPSYNPYSYQQSFPSTSASSFAGTYPYPGGLFAGPTGYNPFSSGIPSSFSSNPYATYSYPNSGINSSVTVHRAIDASDFFHCEKHVCVFWNKF